MLFSFFVASSAPVHRHIDPRLSLPNHMTAFRTFLSRRLRRYGCLSASSTERRLSGRITSILVRRSTASAPADGKRLRRSAGGYSGRSSMNFCAFGLVTNASSDPSFGLPTNFAMSFSICSNSRATTRTQKLLLQVCHTYVFTAATDRYHIIVTASRKDRCHLIATASKKKKASAHDNFSRYVSKKCRLAVSLPLKNVKIREFTPLVAHSSVWRCKQG